MKNIQDKIKTLLDQMAELEESLGLSSEARETIHRMAEGLSKGDDCVDISDFFSVHGAQVGKEARSIAVITTSKPDSSGKCEAVVGMGGDLNDAGDNLMAVVIQACLALRDPDACKRQKAVGVGIVDRLTSIDIDDLDAFIALLEITRKHRACTKH